MKFIVRLQAEITVKSKSVRRRHGKLLTANLRNQLKAIDSQNKVKWMWDRVEVQLAETPSAKDAKAAIECLQSTPGVAHFERVIEHPLTDFETLLNLVLAYKGDELTGQSFAVRVRRKGHHDFSSQDLAKYIGAGVLARVEDCRVQLKKPQQEVQLVVSDKQVFLVERRFQGLGGFPLPSQETVLSLMSGGFDSTVSSYQMIRRGARTHFCFFNLGGDAHEAGVREISYYIWKRFSSTHPVKFISVDFAPVVDRILEDVDNGLMGVVLKRTMLRAAGLATRYVNAQALVTGEAMGQVSSQTLTNLAVIDKASERIVLRPLIAMDKQDIVNIARAIGTEPLAAVMPEYCGVISNKPTVKADLAAVEAAEQVLTDELLEELVYNAQVIDIRNLHDARMQVVDLDIKDEQSSDKVILDIRSLEEQEEAPLPEQPWPIQSLPFFKLESQFPTLARNSHYLLYCDQGVMSRMQALHLREMGFSNVGVYEAKDNSKEG
ncbi:tRNA 4-thiouridine(8) synthase ThiI [Aliidiomarina minuta]|uniref:tRNA sulfurtransferase n=1 Tax=Aliidiomarina minuta TaxID=880057 RepID=A0A432W4T6_9GAMM|nr:tRNA uracil 4-sulfurtransferase ThiI [Aliidiomarina minuta]RUO24417.1 tRNA 4-thiouridine(8) synthase ThiI [Aliidiomarina minuta]